jgi:hypothetical protein
MEGRKVPAGYPWESQTRLSIAWREEGSSVGGIVPLTLVRHLIVMTEIQIFETMDDSVEHEGRTK